MKKLIVVIALLLCGSVFAQEPGVSPKKVKKITEQKVTVTEYSEDRINEAIFNLEKQLVDLQAEIAVWKARGERVKNEG